MGDIEPGTTTVSSKGNPKTGNGASPAAAAVEDPRARALQLHFDTPVGLLRALRDERDADARLEAETFALAHVWATRNATVKSLVPAVKEWVRNPRNSGAEGLVLSIASGARLYAPEVFDELLLVLAASEPSDGRGQRLFVDFSISNKALLSLMDMRTYPAIIAKLALGASAVDVGQAVREQNSAESNGRSEERYMQCVANWMFAGAEIGMMLGAGGGPAGMLGGAFMGASSGATLGGLLCAGFKETALVGSPTFKESGEVDVPDQGVRGKWCWTWPSNWPWPRETRPFWPPRPYPMIPETPPIIPQVPWWGGIIPPRLEAATVEGALPQFGAVVERLGANAFLVHA